jgi:hypothetical protein
MVVRFELGFLFSDQASGKPQPKRCLFGSTARPRGKRKRVVSTEPKIVPRKIARRRLVDTEPKIVLRDIAKRQLEICCTLADKQQGSDPTLDDKIERSNCVKGVSRESK